MAEKLLGPEGFTPLTDLLNEHFISIKQYPLLIDVFHVEQTFAKEPDY